MSGQMKNEGSGTSQNRIHAAPNINIGGGMSSEAGKIDPMQVMAWDLLKQINNLKNVMYGGLFILCLGMSFIGYNSYQTAQQARADYDRYRHAANRLQGIVERAEKLTIVTESDNSTVVIKGAGSKKK